MNFENYRIISCCLQYYKQYKIADLLLALYYDSGFTRNSVYIQKSRQCNNSDLRNIPIRRFQINVL